jgi:tetratricopeptide (TPR) repeat protein
MKALEIDHTLAGPHAALGFTKTHYEWDWAGAEREFQRSIELDPNYATASQWYGAYLGVMGRHDDAIASIKRAQQLDPLALMAGASLGWELYLARRFDDAINQLRKTLELDPNFASGHWWLEPPYEQKAMYREAVAESQKASELSQGSPYALGVLGHAYALSGDRKKSLEIIGQLDELSKSRYVAPFETALIWAGLDNKERALEWLDKAMEDRSWGVMWLKVDPRFDRLRTDPRFVSILQRLGLTL